jgi:peptidoglycan/xylan/chitin deacetylase (PgdA/CDA1 family)
MELISALRRAKTGLVRAAGPLGLYAAAWRVTKHRPRIFMYHRFAAVDTGHRLGRETFRAQLRMIRERCSVVTMAELAGILREAPERATRLAVITVDDGYRDFHDHAWPVLREENIPATFFPCTGFVDGEVWLWPDLVEQALARTENGHISASGLGLSGPQRNWSLRNPDDKRAVWQALIDHAIDLPDKDKWIFLRDLHERLSLDWPTRVPDDYSPVTWEQLRTMAKGGVEIGAHTRTHCRLTRVNAAQLDDELAGAKARIEHEISREVVSLCYPNGAPADYDSRVMAAAEASGYRSAVTAHFDGVQGGLYDLRRHGIGADMYGFRKSLCGVDELSRRLAGAA